MGFRIADWHPAKIHSQDLVAAVEHQIANWCTSGVISAAAGTEIMEKLARVRQRLATPDSANQVAKELRTIIATHRPDGASLLSVGEVDRLLSLL